MPSTENGVRTDTQHSVYLVNKPGILARVVQRLADRKINISALTMMDSTEHGVLRMVCENPARVREALADFDLHHSEQTVLTVTLPNRPGALADVVGRLASQHIEVSYAYCTTGAPGGRTVGVFKVSNPQKAIQVLEERKPRRRDTNLPARPVARSARK